MAKALQSRRGCTHCSSRRPRRPESMRRNAAGLRSTPRSWRRERSRPSLGCFSDASLGQICFSARGDQSSPHGGWSWHVPRPFTNCSKQHDLRRDHSLASSEASCACRCRWNRMPDRCWIGHLRLYHVRLGQELRLRAVKSCVPTPKLVLSRKTLARRGLRSGAADQPSSSQHDDVPPGEYGSVEPFLIRRTLSDFRPFATLIDGEVFADLSGKIARLCHPADGVQS